MNQLLIESVLLGIGGATAGVFFALWTADVLPSFFPAEQVRLLNATIDARVLAYCLVVSAFASVLFGIAPAFQVLRVSTAGVLRRDTVTTSDSATGGRARRAFVVVQVALAFLLMIGAGLLAQSLRNAFQADLGFATRRAAVVSVDLPPDFSRERALLYFDEALARVRSLPGVEQAAVTTVTPLTRGPRQLFQIDGYVPRDGEDMEHFFNIVSPEDFETMRIPIVHGRAFDNRDIAASPRVVMVNEEFAGRYFPSGAVGRSLRDPRGPMTVVGVARARVVLDPRSAPQAVVYFPLAQQPSRSVRVIASSALDPDRMVPSVTAVLREANASAAVFRATTLEAYVDEALSADRLLTALVTTCGGLALMLAAVGLYGMVAYSVASRTREIGIRMALGATAQRVSRLVMTETMTLIAAGTIVGASLAGAVSSFARSTLYGVSPLDPGTYLVVPGVLFAMGAAAAWIPVRRALRVDPARVLRQL